VGKGAGSKRYSGYTDPPLHGNGQWKVGHAQKEKRFNGESNLRRFFIGIYGMGSS